MAVVAVSVESNGWVLAVRGTWGATVGAWTFIDRNDGEWRTAGVNQFPLDPGGTPRITLNVRDAGYDRVGGLPIASSNRPRAVVATKPLRRPYPSEAQLDETDNGDGTRTLRFALSDRIYSTSTIVSASFLLGWRVGEGAAVSAVTNNSTRTVPLPIFRWASEPWPLVRGSAGAPAHSARVEVIIATHHPEHVADADGFRHQACAALLLRAFDGTTSKDFYFSAPQTSPAHGDSLRCWGGNIDLSGLSAGPITVHATVFPWVGSERATGTAHVVDWDAALSAAWGGPFHLYYDPVGATLTPRYVMIDTGAPNSDPNNSVHRAAVTLHTDLASALAAPLANKAANTQVAQAAIGTVLNATWTSRNGYPNVTRFGGYSEFILTAGQTCTPGTLTYGSAGANAGFGYVVIRGDPTNADPRANCLFQSSGTSVQFGNTNRVKLRDCTVRLGTSNIFNIRTGSWVTAENVSWNGIAGQEGGGGQPFGSLANFCAFNSTFRNANSQPTGWLLRNVQRTRANNSSATACMINVTIAPAVAGEFNPGRAVAAFGSGGSNVSDLMLWGCRVSAWQNGMLVAAGATNFGDNIFSARWAVVNTVYELATDPANKVALAIGETGGSALRDSIFETTVITGGRFNWHNDAPFAAATGSLAAVRVNNSPTSTITLGLAAHGLAVGDSITVAGFANGNLNRTTTVTAVLDANRFQYAAAAAVTVVTGSGTRSDMTAPGESQGGPRVTINSGVNSGQTRFVIGHNNVQTGNVVRYCAMDRNATKHDTFSNDGGLIQSWELLYGVGYRGNTNANRGTASPSNFQYAFYGIGSELELTFTGPAASPVASYGVNWFGYVDDLSANGPGEPGGAGSGDYRAHNIPSAPHKPSRLLGKGNRPAVIDRDANNAVRTNFFDGGALGRLSNSALPSVLQPSRAMHPHRAATSVVRWRAPIAIADAGSGMSASEGGVVLVVPPSASLNRQFEVVPDGRDLHVDPE